MKPSDDPNMGRRSKRSSKHTIRLSDEMSCNEIYKQLHHAGYDVTIDWVTNNWTGDYDSTMDLLLCHYMPNAPSNQTLSSLDEAKNVNEKQQEANQTLSSFHEDTNEKEEQQRVTEYFSEAEHDSTTKGKAKKVSMSFYFFDIIQFYKRMILTINVIW